MTDLLLPDEDEEGPRLYTSWSSLTFADEKLLIEGSYSDADLARWGIPDPRPEGWEQVILEWGAPYSEFAAIEVRKERGPSRANG